jgi:signal transduction histidine kinase
MASRFAGPSTVRWRLTLWYAVLLGVPLVGVAGGCYALFARSLYQRTDAFIGDALTAFSRELVAERRAARGPEPAIRSTVAEVRFRDLYISVLDDGGHVVASTTGDPLPAGGRRFDLAAIGAPPAEAGAVTIRTPAGDFRALSRPVLLDGEQFHIAGAYPLHETEAVLDRIRRVLVILVPLLITGAATGGYFLAMRGLAPLSEMTERASRIGASTLRERLPVHGGEELAGLARVVNDLLDRLEASFGQQARFMAEASHELRTPTAILRTEADVTLAQPHRTEAEYRASMGIVRDAAKRLTRIVEDLFLLARADPGAVATRRDEIYLEELVHDATRAVRMLADSRRVRVDVPTVIEAPFIGDADLLGRLLLNLLDNAIKHSRPDTTVSIALSRQGARYEIAVVDAGPGIPPAERERVFEHFVRLDGTGTNQESASDTDHIAPRGAGLGLPIARRIAESHGGTLELAESRPGRTEFRVTLPVDRASARAPAG